MRIHTNPPQVEAKVLDGRGGDGGIDVAVYVNGKIDTIYQLKYFPEGFTGAWGRARKPQIKSSFETAWKNHEPPNWILVIPGNPHVNEEKYVSTLREGRKVRISIWGRARLDSELARFTDLLHAVTRKPLQEVLKTIGQESAALIGPADLAERARRLHQLASGRSSYWDVDFSVAGKSVIESVRAKDPRAAELEPLGFSFAVNTSATDTVQRLQDLVDFGSRRHFVVPGEAIANFAFKGPEWFRHQGTIDRIEFPEPSPLPTDQQIDVTLEFLDEEGAVASHHQGVMTVRSAGERGIAFLAQFYNVVELDTQLPYEVAESGLMHLGLRFTRAAVRDAFDAFQLMEDMSSQTTFRVLLNGSTLMSATTEGLAVPPDESTDSLRDLVLLVEDLNVLQNRLRARFLVPEGVTNRERVMIRVARLLVEGKGTWMPPDTSLTFSLSGEAPEEIRELLKSGGAVTSLNPNLRVKILGTQFALGPAVMYHPSMKVRGGAEEVLRMLDEGTAAGHEIIMDPQGDTLVWVAPNDPREDGMPDSEGWGLPDIPMPGAIDS